QRYARTYSESGLRRKLARYARAAGEEVVEKVLWLFYAAQSPATPRWAKTAIYGALGYFIFPLDVIPDLAPLVGYTDDLGVLAAALTTVAFYINDDIKARTRVQMEKWFGPAPRKRELKSSRSGRHNNQIELTHSFLFFFKNTAFVYFIPTVSAPLDHAEPDDTPMTTRMNKRSTSCNTLCWPAPSPSDCCPPCPPWPRPVRDSSRVPVPPSAPATSTSTRTIAVAPPPPRRARSGARASCSTSSPVIPQVRSASGWTPWARLVSAWIRAAAPPRPTVTATRVPSSRWRTTAARSAISAASTSPARPVSAKPNCASVPCNPNCRC